MFTVRLFTNFIKRQFSNQKTMCDEMDFMYMSKLIVPKLSLEKHKGQAGRIGIVGGSKEYTGAPYFSAISALKVGADLVHVFCTSDSSTVIKSYSPELIVHPILDAKDGIQQIEPWLERLDVIVVGPGLGRSEEITHVVTDLIKLCKDRNKPLVIDADGLFLITHNLSLIENYPNAILTPNAIEFSRLFKIEIDAALDSDETHNKLKDIGENIVIVRKGQVDTIYDYKYSVSCTATGSGRRCGGQGDLLSGSLGTFYAWAMKCPEDTLDKEHLNLRAMIASYMACRLTRECNAKAFDIYGRSMTCSDMIQQIHPSFKELFELPKY